MTTSNTLSFNVSSGSVTLSDAFRDAILAERKRLGINTPEEFMEFEFRGQQHYGFEVLTNEEFGLPDDHPFVTQTRSKDPNVYDGIESVCFVATDHSDIGLSDVNVVEMYHDTDLGKLLGFSISDQVYKGFQEDNLMFRKTDDGDTEYLYTPDGYGRTHIKLICVDLLDLEAPRSQRFLAF